MQAAADVGYEVGNGTAGHSVPGTSTTCTCAAQGGPGIFPQAGTHLTTATSSWLNVTPGFCSLLPVLVLISYIFRPVFTMW